MRGWLRGGGGGGEGGGARRGSGVGRWEIGFQGWGYRLVQVRVDRVIHHLRFACFATLRLPF